MKLIKMLEILLPNNYILNDNNGNTYKINMGKYKWIENAVHTALKYNYLECKYGSLTQDKTRCWVCPKNIIEEHIDKNNVTLLLSHYRLGDRKFDLLNYERCYKPLIDALTASDYFVDDNYSILNNVILTGGNEQNWNNNIWNINNDEKDLSSYIEEKMFVNEKKYNFNLLQIFLVIEE